MYVQRILTTLLLACISALASAEEFRPVNAYQRSESTSGTITYTPIPSVYVRVGDDDGPGPDDPDPGDLSDVAKKYRDMAAEIDDAANTVNVATLFSQTGKAAISGNLAGESVDTISRTISVLLDVGIPTSEQAAWKPLRDAVSADLVELQVTGNGNSTAVGKLFVEIAKGLSAAIGNPDESRAKAIVAGSDRAVNWSVIIRILSCVLSTDFEQDDAFLKMLQCVLGE